MKWVLGSSGLTPKNKQNKGKEKRRFGGPDMLVRRNVNIPAEAIGVPITFNPANLGA